MPDNLEHKMNLGYPIKSLTGVTLWAIDVITKQGDTPEVTTVVFSEEKACEIARRINMYFAEQSLEELKNTTLR